MIDDPVKFSPHQLVTSSYLARNLSQQLDLAKKNSIFIQRDQEVQWVLLGIDEYRILLNKEMKKK